MARTVRYGEGRDVLITATVAIVAEKGLRGLTFRAVSEKAGVNNSLVAHHFGTRDALLASALEWAVEQSIRSTSLLDLGSAEAFIEDFMTSIVREPELQAFQYEMILEARRTPLFRGPVRHLYERYVQATRESLQQVGVDEDLDATARHVFAALDGLVLQYVSGSSEESIRGALHELWVSIAERVAPRV